MAERPIIFSQSMIRALLAGTKTMTRRLLRPQPGGQYGDGRWYADRYNGGPLWCMWGKRGTDVQNKQGEDLKTRFERGDRLWVREAFAVHQRAEARVYAKGDGHPWGSPLYRATFAGGLLPECEGFTKWRPSIFMPRWASRITLAVTGVRVERLQDITEEDARAEGVLYVPGHGEITTAELSADPGYSNFLNCRQGFEVLWNSLHGPGAWESNPWVVVISFERADA